MLLFNVLGQRLEMVGDQVLITIHEHSVKQVRKKRFFSVAMKREVRIYLGKICACDFLHADVQAM